MAQRVQTRQKAPAESARQNEGAAAVQQFPVGQTASRSGVSFALQGVRASRSLDGRRPAAGRIFLVLDVTVRNGWNGRLDPGVSAVQQLIWEAPADATSARLLVGARAWGDYMAEYHVDDLGARIQQTSP